MSANDDRAGAATARHHHDAPTIEELSVDDIDEQMLAPDVGVITMTELAVVDDVEDDESLDEDPGDELSDEVDEADDEDPLGTDDGTEVPG